MLQQYRKQIVAGLAVLAIAVAYFTGDIDLGTALGQAVNTITPAL